LDIWPPEIGKQEARHENIYRDTIKNYTQSLPLCQEIRGKFSLCSFSPKTRKKDTLSCPFSHL
jgi:hypothetical protein